MTVRTLHGCRILVVEDEYMLADDLDCELTGIGAVVLGPVGTVADALALIATSGAIDLALLDINLSGDLIFQVADLLAARGVPIVFTTGYDQAALRAHFAGLPRCEKPVNLRRVTDAIGRAVHAGEAA